MIVERAVLALVGASLIAANPSWPASDPELPADALSDPDKMPDDPDFAPANDPLVGCRGQLELYSFTPECTPSIAARERARGLGAGIHADRAWLWTTGDARVVIAIADSGVDWSDRDLIARWRLSVGELPPPQTSTRTDPQHDQNHDGIFSVLDFTSALPGEAPTLDKVIDRNLLRRRDRGDVNGNGLLDPQDLIRLFSDGTDGDQNGFVDDICGWDFIDDDNDVADPAGADGSGTRRARTAVATANNGIRGAGVCPSCTALPLRVSLSDLAPAHTLASSLLYAADAGARVLLATAAAVERSTFLDQSVRYARFREMLVVAAAGHDAGTTPNVPWNPELVLVVGGIRHDDSNLTNATTAVGGDPCSRTGAQLSLVAPGNCDELPAALAAGAAGLLFSTALGIPNHGVPPLVPSLSAAEAMQLLRVNADDLVPVVPEETSVRRATAPSIQLAEGWDLTTGAGRVNARAAVDAVVQRRIPVAVGLDGPRWWSFHDPTLGTGIIVKGFVDNGRDARVRWALEFAPGLAPPPESFTTFASGTVETPERVEVQGTLPTARLFSDPSRPPEAFGDFSVTIRLTANAANAGEVTSAEVHRVIFVHRDLELLPAFPVNLGAGVVASPRVGDIDGDDAEEIVVATVDGTVHVLGATGRSLEGWPQSVPVLGALAPSSNRRLAAAFTSGQVSADVLEPVLAAPSLLLRADHENRVAVMTSGGSLLWYRPDGSLEPRFPVSFGARRSADAPAGATQSPVLVDLDQDGKLEIVIAGNDRRLHVVRENGELFDGFPVELDEVVGSPAVGDLDGDGRTDIVAVGRTRVYAIHGDGLDHEEGPHLVGWPRELGATPTPQGIEALHLPAPIIGDLDGDGHAEVVVTRRGKRTEVYRSSGAETLVTLATARDALGARSDVSSEGAPFLSASGHAIVADLDHTGSWQAIHGVIVEPYFSALGPTDVFESAVGAWNLDDGDWSIGFPRTAHRPFMLDAAVADIDGDRHDEVIVGGSDRALAYARLGTTPRLWPKLTGSPVVGTPNLADLDGDGRFEVVAATQEGLVFAWRTTGQSAAGTQWEGHRHDVRATGNLATITTRRAPLGTSGGCGCRGTKGGSTWLLLLVGILAMIGKLRPIL